jgi:hypothetical protein
MTSTIFVPQILSMSGEAHYASMQDLVAQLSDLLEGIEKGTASVDDLDQMVSQARELYERLVVIRHKAFDILVPKTGHETAQPQSFKLVDIDPIVEEKQVSNPQTSLIDVIEEVEKENSGEVTVEDDVELDQQEAGGNGQMSISDAEEDGEEVEVDEPEVVVEEIEITVEVPIEEARPVSQAVPKEKNKTKEDHKQSLAEKLEHTPIGDLKKAIALNQKFLFINELFAKNSEQYESAVSTLNAFSALPDAKDYLEELATSLKWAEESEARETFIELVERRYA